MKKITKWFRQCTSSQEQPDKKMRPGERLELPKDFVIPDPGELTDKKYHVFISHVSEDLSVSERLRDILEQHKFKVFHTGRDFLPGTHIIKGIDEMIKQSRRTLTILSSDAMKSETIEFEFAISKAEEHERNEVTLVPILHGLSTDDVPPYVKETNCYLDMNQETFWSKLFKLLTDSGPLTAAIPAGNVAHGIAWSHYYGYLSQVLPDIDKRTMASEFPRKLEKGMKILPKLITILPETCNCPNRIEYLDETIECVGSIPFKASRAGKLDRSYKTTVYKVTDPDNPEKEYYALLECPMTLSVLFAMKMGRICNMDAEEKKRQARLFKDKMNEIINHPSIPQCHGQAVFISYDDNDDYEKGRLSRVLVNCIREELKQMDEWKGTPGASPSDDKDMSSVTAMMGTVSVTTSSSVELTDLPALRPMPDELTKHTTFPELGKEKYHVFISSNDEDKELAFHLASELERIPGMSCFEPHRDKLGGNSKFAGDMDNCAMVITLVSETYLTDNWSSFEQINTISKSCEDGWKITVPVLHKIDVNQVPPYVREVNYLETSLSDFWPRLVKALQMNRIPLHAVIPTTDIVDGLAWAYYYNYLGFILPGLKGRIEQSKYNKDSNVPVLAKFILLLPRSGYCAKRLTEIDSNITYEKDRLEFRRTTSGSVGRDYGNSVLKIKDPDHDNKEYYIVMEYATPMWTMYEMEMGRLAGLSPRDKQQQMDDFIRKLKEILNNDRIGDCSDLITLDYDDHDPAVRDDPHHLSRAVMKLVRQELD